MKHIRILSLFLILIVVLMSACSTDSNNSNDYTKYISVSNERIGREYVGGEWKSCYYVEIYNKTDNSINVCLLLNQYSMLGGGYVGNLPCEYVFAPKERRTVGRLIPNSGVTVEAEWKVKVIE